MEVTKDYKKTEVGIIPEDWTVKTLGDVGEVRMCKRVFNHQTSTSGSIPFYKIGTFGKEPDAFISQDLYDSYRHKFSFPQNGDILISAAGTIGRTIVYDGKPAYFQDSNIVWLDNKHTLINNEFLYYTLQVVKYNTEGGTIQRLYNSILRNTKFICPTPKEQPAIATALSDADALISSLEKLIAKKHNIKQGAMQQLLQPKEGWEVKKLGDVCTIFKGKGLAKSSVTDNGIRQCILYGELFTTYREVIKSVVSRTNMNEGVISRKGDLLFPGSTTTTGIDLAKCSALMLEDVLLGGDIIILRKKALDYNPQFLTYFLNSQRTKEIAEKTKGITIHHLYGSDLFDIEVAFPPIEIQNEIATIFLFKDAEIMELGKKLEKYKQIKQGMMQQLLTGKIRLV